MHIVTKEEMASEHAQSFHPETTPKALMAAFCRCHSEKLFT